MGGHLSKKRKDLCKRIDRLVARRQYQAALQAVKRNPLNRNARDLLLYYLVKAVRRVEDPLTLGEEHRDALISLTEDFRADCIVSWWPIFTTYYPHKVSAMFETFTKAKDLDQDVFMQTIFTALECSLWVHVIAIFTAKPLDAHAFSRGFAQLQLGDWFGDWSICPCREADACNCFDFASYVLSAGKPLHYGSSYGADNCSLFSSAVKYDLLAEARLLYDTGAVYNSELACLARRDRQVQKMLDEDEDTPMATFLRSVMRQPRSLFSAACLEVSSLLGHDVRGRQDRAQSLGLPHCLYNEVLFIRQAADYRHAVMLRCEKEKQKRTEAETSDGY